MVSVRQAIENRALKQGVQQGIEQGVTKTAQNMLKYGASMDLIKKSTGLSQKQVENLSKK